MFNEENWLEYNFYCLIKDHNSPFFITLIFFLASVPLEEKGPLVSHARKTSLKKKTEILCGLRASDLFRYYQDESHINAVAILLLMKLILHK